MDKVLISLAEQIREEHAATLDGARNTITHALRVGELLCDVKDLCGYGSFKEWVVDNCGFTDRTARTYMRIFRNKEQLQNGSEFPLLSITEAVAQLTAPKIVDEAFGLSMDASYKFWQEERRQEKEEELKSLANSFDGSIKTLLDQIRVFRQNLEDGEKFILLGRYSPEAKVFTRRKLRALAGALNKYIEMLE
jgi:hypothetical protein